MTPRRLQSCHRGHRCRDPNKTMLLSTQERSGRHPAAAACDSTSEKPEKGHRRSAVDKADYKIPPTATQSWKQGKDRSPVSSFSGLEGSVSMVHPELLPSHFKRKWERCLQLSASWPRLEEGQSEPQNLPRVPNQCHCPFREFHIVCNDQSSNP